LGKRSEAIAFNSSFEEILFLTAVAGERPVPPRQGSNGDIVNYMEQHITEEWVDTMMRVVTLPKYQ